MVGETDRASLGRGPEGGPVFRVRKPTFRVRLRPRHFVRSVSGFCRSNGPESCAPTGETPYKPFRAHYGVSAPDAYGLPSGAAIRELPPGIGLSAGYLSVVDCGTCPVAEAGRRWRAWTIGDRLLLMRMEFWRTTCSRRHPVGNLDRTEAASS